jgi:hypothetical protein
MLLPLVPHKAFHLFRAVAPFRHQPKMFGFHLLPMLPMIPFLWEVWAVLTRLFNFWEAAVQA